MKPAEIRVNRAVNALFTLFVAGNEILRFSSRTAVNDGLHPR